MTSHAQAEAVELDGQYRVLREGAGVVIRAERGLLAANGPDAAEYLQGQLTNDVEALAPGEGCYAALLDRKGRMEADARVLRVSAEEFWLDTEGPARQALIDHLQRYKIGRDVAVEDRSEDRAVVSLIGPAAREISGATQLSAEHTHSPLEVASAPVRGVATDVGVDLICGSGDIEAVTAELSAGGAAEVSEAAAEILRVESGRPRFGYEMGTETIPQEAGINERAVSFTKGCYIGQETVARLHYKGKPNRHLRGLRLSEPASRGEELALDGRPVGTIGTACLSPALGTIALAVVRREAVPGTRLSVGEGERTAEVVELPFTSG